MPAASAPGSAAPSDANLTGHVVDKTTGEHLPYFRIQLTGTSIATLTDASGHYSLRNIKPGRYTVEASLVGYAPIKKEVTLERDRTTELNFDVEPDAFMETSIN